MSSHFEHNSLFPTWPLNSCPFPQLHILLSIYSKSLFRFPPKSKPKFPITLPNFHQNLILPNQSSIMAAESQPQLIVRSIHFICFPSLLFYFPCVGLNFQNETILFPTCLLLSTVLLWLVFFGMRVFYCSGFVYLSRVWIWLKFQDEILFAMFCLFI